MKIQTATAIKTANIIIDFFSNIDRIDDYFRLRKIERVKNLPPSIPGFGLEDEIFQDYAQLKDLKDLLDSGVLTNEEFEKAKKKLLN